LAVSAAERRVLLDQINRLAQTDLNNLWRAAELLADNDFFDYMLAGFPELAGNYHQVAAQVAANWFEESDPLSTYVARVATPLAAERLTGTARWALGGDGTQALSRMTGSLQRATFDGARDTVFDNVETSGARWIRVARPNACGFCRLLATRTGESSYSSKAAAVNVVGRRNRGSRRRGEKFHDDCYCQPVEIRGNQDVGDVLSPQDAALVDQWNDEYLKARANAGTGDPKQILAAWRQQGVS
jgi:hypothetical protein